MTVMRRCSRTGCGRGAVATLTYVYAEQTAVLGPLATYAEPHTYDLCVFHAERQTAPQGWEMLQLITDFAALEPAGDDLLAVASAVSRPRSTTRRTPPPSDPPAAAGDPASPSAARSPRTSSRGGPSAGSASGKGRGHLRVLPDG